MKNNTIIVIVLLMGLGSLSGCATVSMWEEANGPGAYREGDVEEQPVEELYVLPSREGATFLVPGHPSEESVFALTVPGYTRDVERFTENFSSPDSGFAVQAVKMAVGLYEGRGYRVDVDFISNLPVDQVVELFAGSGVITEESYQQVVEERDLNLQIHYGSALSIFSGGRGRISHYTYSMSDEQATVTAGVLPRSNEPELLVRSHLVPLTKDGRNFSYVVYEYRHESEIPLVAKVVATPVTLAVDAVSTVAVTVVAIPVGLFVVCMLYH